MSGLPSGRPGQRGSVTRAGLVPGRGRSDAARDDTARTARPQSAFDATRICRIPARPGVSRLPAVIPVLRGRGPWYLVPASRQWAARPPSPVERLDGRLAAGNISIDEYRTPRVKLEHRPPNGALRTHWAATTAAGLVPALACVWAAFGPGR